MSDLAADLVTSATRFESAALACSAEHWHAKPAPEVWSVAQVVEHVIKVELRVCGALAAAAESELPEDAATVPGSELRRGLLDRTIHAPAPAPVEPSADPATREELLPQYAAARRALVELHASLGDGLAKRHVRHFRFGNLDGIRWLELLTAHAERHAEQIDEIRRTLAARTS